MRIRFARCKVASRHRRNLSEIHIEKLGGLFAFWHCRHILPAPHRWGQRVQDNSHSRHWSAPLCAEPHQVMSLPAPHGLEYTIGEHPVAILPFREILILWITMIWFFDFQCYYIPHTSTWPNKRTALIMWLLADEFIKLPKSYGHPDRTLSSDTTEAARGSSQNRHVSSWLLC